MDLIYCWIRLKVMESCPEFECVFEGRIVVKRDGLGTRSVLRNMLGRKDYRTLDIVFLFVSAFIIRRTRHDRTAPLTKVRARYGGIVCDVTKEEA